MRSSFIFSVLAVVAPVLGAPTLVPITKRAGPSKENSYILSFKDGASKSTAVEALRQKFEEPDSRSSMTYEYGDFFHGVAAVIASPDMLKFVQSMNDIASIEPDATVSLSYELGLDGLRDSKATEDAAISPVAPRGNGDGSGVNIYSVDTGIYTAHECFGGRAHWGATFGKGYKDHDGNGHGTHTAGTAAGVGYGPATGAQLFAVKVMSDEGSGSTSDIIAGLEWVAKHVRDQGKDQDKASIVNMSIGGLADSATDKAVEKIIDAGIHVTVAAGNDAAPAALFSPARVKAANTVAAVDKDDGRAYFSNHGEPVDVWYLGVDVNSAWIDGPKSEMVASGTSMAAPGVAGLLAVAISKHGNKSPADLSSDLTGHALKVRRVGGTEVMTDLIAQGW